MTLSDLEWLSKISNDMKRRVASVGQLNFSVLQRGQTVNWSTSTVDVTRSSAIADKLRDAVL